MNRGEGVTQPSPHNGNRSAHEKERDTSRRDGRWGRMDRPTPNLNQNGRLLRPFCPAPNPICPQNDQKSVQTGPILDARRAPPSHRGTSSLGRSSFASIPEIASGAPSIGSRSRDRRPRANVRFQGSPVPRFFLPRLATADSLPLSPSPVVQQTAPRRPRRRTGEADNALSLGRVATTYTMPLSTLPRGEFDCRGMR
ncbi:hypothetical protein Pan216_17220 [Planctomycetes bacterium Pan216]|uniref:Uncharacterized protein n=1 Tax=Kolteria novifilia TaxID=2527975 RepID=A0A518B1K8_9BACT|nr:hypothetical protein Pan216_17220 [Planctomycetes bacterium Pan216]